MSSSPDQDVDRSPQLSLRFMPGFNIYKATLGCIFRCRAIGFMVLLAFTLLALFTSTQWLTYVSPELRGFIHNTLFIACFSLLFISLYSLWVDLLKPVLDMEEWTQQMRSGNLGYKMAVPAHGEVHRLSEDLNDLGTMMNHLAKDTEEQLHQHTLHTEQKTQSLSILYDVAASINVSSSLEDLLKRFLKTLTGVIKADAGAVRLVNTDDRMELVASIGFDDELIAREKLLPAESCVCGQIEKCDDLLFQETLLPCAKNVNHPFFGSALGLIVVPLQYQSQILGVFNLFVKKEIFDTKNNDDYRELFTSIGRHLGMAIAKARLDEESNKLSIMQERNRISYELHDSLAQTLASIRLQVRVLDEILHQDDEETIWQQMERIENTVDEANTELRSLIAHFQAPIRKQALIPAVQEIVKRFRAESDIHIFFQHTINEPLNLADRHHIEVVRIIQEALNNIRKHSQANVARIMIRCPQKNRLQILVEDDGTGLIKSSKDAKPGEQIGLNSMKERASRIKAEFSLESDPGEGTRIILEFDLEKAQSVREPVKIEAAFNLT